MWETQVQIPALPNSEQRFEPGPWHPHTKVNHWIMQLAALTGAMNIKLFTQSGTALQRAVGTDSIAWWLGHSSSM